MNKRMINNVIVGVMIIIIFILTYLVIKPILFSIIFGLLFAYVFEPVHRKIYKSVRNKTLSAALLIILIAVVIILPFVYYTPILIEQIFILFEDIKGVNIAELIVTVFPFVQPGSTAYSILLNLNNVPGQVVSGLTSTLFAMVVNLPNIAIQLFVFSFTFFFAIRDSDRLIQYVSDLSPFSKATERRFLREFRGITNSVILGQVFIGVVQGVLIGICLWFLGFDNVITWTLITSIVSIVPIIGAWLVWIPMAIFLLVGGQTTSAVVLALYGGLFVGNVDNILRPYILSKSSRLPIVASLIGTIGGLYFLGIIGLVLGPLILAYALIIIEFYKEGRLDELYRDIGTRSVGSYEIRH